MMLMHGGLILALGVLAATSAHAQGFTVSSPDIREGSTIKPAQVFNQFGCTGKNISPAVRWSGAPAGTKSFAVTLFDPDAPTGSGFWHWVIFDIPGNVTSLAEGAGDAHSAALPKGALQVRNDYGSPGYGGPCPPKGDKPHRYVLTVYAVDLAALGPKADATPAVVGFNLHYHTLAKATVTGLYGR